jgi:hypothetical protein
MVYYSNGTVQRRTLLRRGALALSVPLAGCSSSNDTDDGGGNDTEGSGNGDDSGGPATVGASGKQRTIEVFPEGVRENVEVLSVEEVEATDRRVEVDVTLRNDSSESVRMDHYAISLTAFSTETPTGESTDRVTTQSSIQYVTNEQEPTPPEETVTLGFSIRVPEDSSGTIESYTVSVGCGGVYDPPGCG